MWLGECEYGFHRNAPALEAHWIECGASGTGRGSESRRVDQHTSLTPSAQPPHFNLVLATFHRPKAQLSPFVFLRAPCAKGRRSRSGISGRREWGRPPQHPPPPLHRRPRRRASPRCALPRRSCCCRWLLVQAQAPWPRLQQHPWSASRSCFRSRCVPPFFPTSVWRLSFPSLLRGHI